MHAHDPEAEKEKMHLIDDENDKSLRCSASLIAAPSSTLIEQVINFVDRSMAPGRGKKVDPQR